MSKTHHFKELPGTRELYTLLNIINNKDKYEKILEELEGARFNANKAIEEKGLAGEIEALHSQARADRGQAKHDLDEARETAQNLVSEGQGALAQCLKEVKEQRDKVGLEVKSASEELSVRESQLNGKKESLDRTEIILQKKQSELDQKAEHLEKLEKDIEEKRQILSDSIEKLQ